jgi:general secretion pathway protein L
MNWHSNSSLRRLKIIYLAPVGRVLHEFWTWWRSEIRSLLPKSMQSLLDTAAERHFLIVTDKEIVVRRGSFLRSREVGRQPLKEGELIPALTDKSGGKVLLLSLNQVLAKKITLPVATEENLREVLTFEMDQQTPFNADQVYFDFDITSRSEDRRTIDVELRVTPRRNTSHLVDLLVRKGIKPTAIAAQSPDGTFHEIMLDVDEPVIPNMLHSIGLTGALAFATAALAILAVSLPIIQKQLAIAELESQVVEALEHTGEGARLRDDIEQVAKSARDLVIMKQEQPAILDLLEEMTRVIPNDTWLTHIDIVGGEVQIQGLSEEAAILISAIENSTVFENPEFRSAVTQVPRLNSEQFHLAAAWQSEGSQ